MLGRLSGKTIAPISKTARYTYLSGEHGVNSTTTLVGSVTQNGVTTNYAYDANGNITGIKENGATLKSYVYGDSEWKDLLTA